MGADERAAGDIDRDHQMTGAVGFRIASLIMETCLCFALCAERVLLPVLETDKIVWSSAAVS
jgi:hypothetical protein